MRPDGDASSGLRSPAPLLPSNGSASARSPGRKPGLVGDYTNGKALARVESSNGTHHTNGHDHRTRAAMASRTTAFGHDRAELTRLIMQSLAELGYDDAAATLQGESGVELEGPTIAKFRNAVLQGRWAEVEHLLLGRSDDSSEHPGPCDDEVMRMSGVDRGVGSMHPWQHAGLAQEPGRNHLPQATEYEIKFWIRRQKYLELLEVRDLIGALGVLQQEIMPLRTGEARLNKLSALLMCNSEDDVRQNAEWDGVAGGSRATLLSSLSKFVPPTLMIPESRLEILLRQTKDNWISKCLYHTWNEEPSLYTDHECAKEHFPLKTQYVLSHHVDEVWYLKFSNDGSRLATTSKDSTIMIYDTTNFQLTKQLSEHGSGVCHVAWSPDDTRLISCAQAQDKSAKMWDMQTGDALFTLDHYTYAVTAAAWAQNGLYFVTGSQDKDHALELYGVSGNRVHSWKDDNLRVHDLAIVPDGSTMVVLTEMHFIVYDFRTREKIYEMAIDHGAKLTSLSISHDSRSMLLSMNDNRISLRDIQTGNVEHEFTGHQQTQFIIRSAFGGADENFVVSGSEDSRIYIWRRNGALVEALDAHANGCVNAVAWHPHDPRVFASCGDDHRVRIWCPNTWPSNVSTSPASRSIDRY